MAERYVVIYDGTSDARYGPDRTNAKAAFLGSDSTDSYRLKYRKNGTLTKLTDQDTILADIAVKAGFAAVTDRATKVAVTTITGAALHAAVQSWANPEAGSIVITRCALLVSTVATGACKIDVGVTAVSATTAADNLIDGLDANAAVAAFTAGGGDGTNDRHVQSLATGKWVTVKEISGDATGGVYVLYVEYVNA